MKAIFSLVVVLFITNSYAQKFDCSSKIEEYQKLYKAKNVSAAYDSWNEVRKNCPKQSESIYTEGLDILQYKIDNAASDEEKTTLVREVLKVYDQYNKNFPSTTADFEVKKAMVLFNNKIDAKDEIFALLESGFSKASKSITDATAIYTYFNLCHEKYNAGDKKFTAELVLDKYTLVSSLLSDLEQSNPGASSEYKTAQRSINALAKDLVSCDNLSAYYEKNFELNKDKTEWLATALTTLSAKCSAKPIFNTMAERLYAVKATSQSAYFMALATLKQRKFEESIKFYNQAADLETNPLEKARIYYTLATGLLANDMAKSKENLNKALKNDPKMGRAYLFLAQLYSYAPEQDCNGTDFEKKAIYYLAVQTAKKAGEVEPRLKPATDKMVEELKDKALTTADINKEKMAGKTFDIGCWIKETITFPAK